MIYDHSLSDFRVYIGTAGNYIIKYFTNSTIFQGLDVDTNVTKYYILQQYESYANEDNNKGSIFFYVVSLYYSKTNKKGLTT